jgi:hypothetical protein
MDVDDGMTGEIGVEEGLVGDTGVEEGRTIVVEGGITGEIGVPLGGETGGTIDPVGPDGPYGCVPL